jgi:S-disulfanyl-L-cysteine oxidoreductase SoxD
VKLFLTLLLGTIVCGTALIALHAQDNASTSSGVYTTQQADRGKAIYQSKCSTCHGDDLSGGGTSPALAGPDFEGKWTGRPVAALYNSIHTSMPSDQPGTLSAQQTSDLIAFLLKANKFPAGKTELPADINHLKSILIDDAP